MFTLSRVPCNWSPTDGSILSNNIPVQARNQDFMWGGANEAKVDQTTEMFFLFNFFLMETSEFCNFFFEFFKLFLKFFILFY